MSYEKHLYAIVYPSEALIASQYNPAQFAQHYIAGSTRYYDGKVLFFEVDTSYRNDYFDIQSGLDALVPHSDGRPKATKFVKTYRVLEHIALGAMKNLYLTNPDGSCLELQEDNGEIATREKNILRIFAEIDPLSMLVLTRLNYVDFGKYITAAENPKSCPTLCYTQLEFDSDSFLEEFEKNSVMPAPIPCVHPSKLRNAIFELLSKPEKTTKGLSLDSNFNKIAYKTIRHGFMFASAEGTKFYRMPSNKEIEDKNFRFWKAMF
ncbi:MAG: hypothetical protein JXR63_10050 [Spirochaetales bacterium]|nr:hypothetical protein [Spirochaetales bacterium]